MSTNHYKDHPVRQIAVWIDHQEAFVAIFTNAHLLREEELFSGAGPHIHDAGWSQKHLEAHRHSVLEHFYKEVIQEMKDADSIIIYGPGQAKNELHQHINHQNKELSQRIAKLVTTDKLSEYQFIHLALNDLVALSR